MSVIIVRFERIPGRTEGNAAINFFQCRFAINSTDWRQTVKLKSERCREMYYLHPQTSSWPGRLSRARAPPIGDASSKIDPL
jgi:hypothetical protein